MARKLLRGDDRGSLTLEQALIAALLVLVSAGALAGLGVALVGRYQAATATIGVTSPDGGGGGEPAAVAPTSAPEPVLTMVSGQPRLDWGAVEGASGYELEWSTDGGTTWSPLATPAGTGYTDAGTGNGLTTVAADDFNRADSAGASVTNLSTGSSVAWNQTNAYLQLRNGHVYRNSTASANAKAWDTGHSLADGQVQVTRLTAASQPNLYARITDSTHNYGAKFYPDGSVEINAAAGAVPTVIASAPAGTCTPAAGQVIAFRVVGTTLTAYVDGTAVLTATDGSRTAAGYWGFGISDLPTGSSLGLEFADDAVVSSFSRTTYSYRLRATNGAGAGPWSSSVDSPPLP